MLLPLPHFDQLPQLVQRAIDLTMDGHETGTQQQQQQLHVGCVIDVIQLGPPRLYRALSANTARATPTFPHLTTNTVNLLFVICFIGTEVTAYRRIAVILLKKIVSCYHSMHRINIILRKL